MVNTNCAPVYTVIQLPGKMHLLTVNIFPIYMYTSNTFRQTYNVVYCG